MGQTKEGAAKNAYLQHCKSYKRKEPPTSPPSPKKITPIPPLGLQGAWPGGSPKKQRTLDTFADPNYVSR